MSPMDYTAKLRKVNSISFEVRAIKGVELANQQRMRHMADHDVGIFCMCMYFEPVIMKL